MGRVRYPPFIVHAADRTVVSVTPRRARRIREVLDQRQPDLRMVTDYVHKGHNLSAIVRSCDAFGVLWMHSVIAERDHRLLRGSAMGSQRWVEVERHATIEAALGPLRQAGYQVVAARRGDGALDYREVDLTRPTAIVMGAEKYGLSEAAGAWIDTPVEIPMVGMVESFNVSVAAALLLAQAFDQRQRAGMYGVRRLDDATWRRLFFEWGEPTLARFCQRRGLAYPEIDLDSGQLLDPGWAARVQRVGHSE